MASFFKFLQDNQDVTADKIIEKFGNMCKNTAYNYLKKPAIHIKKTFLYQERNEERRKEFKAKIAEIKEENLVYIDESGQRVLCLRMGSKREEIICRRACI